MLLLPFIIIVVLLTAALGYIISFLEKDAIMRDWANQRCNIPVMMTASFFKPDSDPRSSTSFATDNFTFCMGQIVESVLQTIMKPLYSVFESQFGVSTTLSTVVDSIKLTVATMFKEFMSFFTDFFSRYLGGILQASNQMRYVQQSFERLKTTVISFIYMAISAMAGFLSFKNFVIKVVLIILAILTSLIIILFFILWPFFGVIVAVIGVLTGVLGGAALGGAATAFCFSPGTQIMLKDGASLSIEKIKVGMELQTGDIVEDIIQMDGKSTYLYNLNGVHVSGSHLVRNADNTKWISVADDSRANITNKREQILYCLNTSAHIIPVYSHTSERIIFRDWEELPLNFDLAQSGWNRIVDKLINKKSTHSVEKKYTQSEYNTPSISQNTFIYTPKGMKKIDHICMNDIVYDENNNETRVLGIVQSARINRRYQGLIIRKNDAWCQNTSSTYTTNTFENSFMLITEAGTFKFMDTDTNRLITTRDFTEVGYKDIHKTYEYTQYMLRLSDTLHNCIKLSI
jgi:hypothetical protein